MDQEKIVYFGFDECVGSSMDSHIVIAMTVSRNIEEVRNGSPSEKQRAITKDLLSQEFLYAHIDKKREERRAKVMHKATEELIHQGINRFCNDDEVIGLYFDGNDGLIQKMESLQNHPQYNFREVNFIPQGDKKIALIWKADNLANTLYHYHSTSPRSIERIQRARSIYPKLDERIAQAKIYFPQTLNRKRPSSYYERILISLQSLS